jgi:FAD/FMN-containing dehydrogenase
VAYYTPPSAPDVPLADLSPAAVEITEMPYFDWLNRIYEVVQQLIALRLPGPWLNVFIPDQAVSEYVRDVLATTSPADAGVALLYPFRRELVDEPFVRLPDSPVVFLLALLRAANPPEIQRLLTKNRAEYDKAVEVGGTHYPVGAIPLTPADWRAHYGARWPAFRATKRRYDPRHVLAPGQGIFE